MSVFLQNFLLVCSQINSPMLYFEDSFISEWIKCPNAGGGCLWSWGSWWAKRLVSYTSILWAQSHLPPILSEHLNPVQGAAFDDGGAQASKCMPGIQVDIIEKIQKKMGDWKTLYAESILLQALDSQQGTNYRLAQLSLSLCSSSCMPHLSHRYWVVLLSRKQTSILGRCLLDRTPFLSTNHHIL